MTEIKEMTEAQRAEAIDGIKVYLLGNRVIVERKFDGMILCSEPVRDDNVRLATKHAVTDAIARYHKM